MRVLLAALSTVAAMAVTVYLLRPMALPSTATLAVAEVVLPSNTPRGMVFLFSGTEGYRATDRRSAHAISEAGGIVVGIDLARTFAKAGSLARKCVYFVSDMEEISQTLQRNLKMVSYAHPIVAGANEGATMALAIAAQTPYATIRHYIAVDPGASLPFEHELCTGAPHHKNEDGSGWTYGLQQGKLPAPVQVFETAASNAEGNAHIASLVAQGFAIEERIKQFQQKCERFCARESRQNNKLEQAIILEKAVAAVLAKIPTGAGGDIDDLPLAILPARTPGKIMAIVLSGDGGWRDIDREIAGFLVSRGVSAVGIDSLRYFWTEKSPQTIADDLSRIMDHFKGAWQADKVILIGYSFGADVLPAAYNRLSGVEKAKVSIVSLLGLSANAAFQFDVSGWFGGGGDPAHPTLPEVAAMPPDIVQCIYGEDDNESICPRLKGSGVEVIGLPGGHHFDDDYEGVAREIMKRAASVSQ